MTKLSIAPRDIVQLAIRSGRSRFQAYSGFETEFQKALGCDLDYARRLLNGTRLLRDRHREVIRELLQMPGLNLDASARDIAIHLGLSSHDALLAMSGEATGLDFASRTRDLVSIARLSDLVSGYWELYFWSFSRTDVQAISRGICLIAAADEQGLLPCTIYDVNFTYRGVLFPVMSHLYFMFEKDRLLDEIVVYLTNRPERAPPVLRGIALGLSGGVDDIRSHPTASRVSFRFLGQSADEIRERIPDAPQADEQLLEHLRKTIPRYLTREELDALDPSEIAAMQLPRLDNTVRRDAVPFVLQAID